YQGSQAAMALRVDAILSGLRVSGYAAPAKVEIVARAAEGDRAQIAPLVAEVIAKNVSVIMASGPLALNAARSATRTIPIVAIDFETDPIASGVAASLARPGGNITGVFLDFPDFTAKWMEMLVESNPKLSRAAVLWDPDTGPVQLDSVRKVARTLDIQLEVLEVHRASDFDAAFLMANQRGVGGAAFTFFALKGSAIWRPLVVIAFEDIGIGSLDALTMTVATANDSGWRKNNGGDLRLALGLTGMLSQV